MNSEKNKKSPKPKKETVTKKKETVTQNKIQIKEESKQPTLKEYSAEKLNAELKSINNKIEKLSLELSNNDIIMKEKQETLNKLNDDLAVLNTLKSKVDSIYI
jgi:chromosome segregation ATPase